MRRKREIVLDKLESRKQANVIENSFLPTNEANSVPLPERTQMCM
jgi:hypothetical protein